MKKAILLIVVTILIITPNIAQETTTGELIIWIKDNTGGTEITIQVDLVSSLCWDAWNDYPNKHDLTNQYPGSSQSTTLNNEDLNWEGCWSYPGYEHAFGLGYYKVTACQIVNNGEGICEIKDYFFIDYRTSDLPENFDTGGLGDVEVDFSVTNGKFYYKATQNLFPTYTSIWDFHNWIDSVTTELEPLPPENLSWYNFYEHPRLQWNHSSNTEDYVTNYEIHRNTGEGWDLIATQSAVLLYYVDWEIDLKGPPEPDYLYYKVRSKNGTRTSDEFSNIVKVAGPGDFGKDSQNDILLRENNFSYELKQNYPNPFNPTTIINFSIEDESNVIITIYDILGSQVSTLINERLLPGNYKVEFDAGQLKSGIYFYEIRSDIYRDVKKLILLK